MQWTGDPKRDQEINRGLSIVQMKSAFGAIVQAMKGFELPGSTKGYLPTLVEEFQILFRSGVIRLQVFSDEEAKQFGLVSLAHGTSEEKERTVLFIGIHPGLTNAFFSDQTPTDKREEILAAVVKTVIKIRERFHQLQNSGARFGGTMAIAGMSGYTLHDERLRYLESDKRVPSENYGIIIYTVIGNQCIFTQATQDRNSSINRAEWIIMDIAKIERIDPKQFHFFDLQTGLGYGFDEENALNGEFEYSELEMEWKGDWPSVKYWPVTPCPDNIVGLFSPLIGPRPRQKNVPQ